MARHWLVAVLFLFALFFGNLAIAPFCYKFEDELTNLAGLTPMDLGGAEAELPTDFEALLPRRIHAAASTLFVPLVLMHVGAAFYHQIILRDGLINRVWFGSQGPQRKFCDKNCIDRGATSIGARVALKLKAGGHHV